MFHREQCSNNFSISCIYRHDCAPSDDSLTSKLNYRTKSIWNCMWITTEEFSCYCVYFVWAKWGHWQAAFIGKVRHAICRFYGSVTCMGNIVIFTAICSLFGNILGSMHGWLESMKEQEIFKDGNISQTIIHNLFHIYHIQPLNKYSWKSFQTSYRVLNGRVFNLKKLCCYFPFHYF